MNDLSALSHQVLHLQPQIARLIRKVVLKVSNGKLSLPHYRVLRFLTEGVDTVSSLAAAQGVSQPAMSATVEALTEAQFVSRHTSSKDRRRLDLKMTTKGKAFIRKVNLGVEKDLFEVLTRIDPADRQKIRWSLEILGSAFAAKNSKSK